jgi:hypothetical protein
LDQRIAVELIAVRAAKLPEKVTVSVARLQILKVKNVEEIARRKKKKLVLFSSFREVCVKKSQILCSQKSLEIHG